MLRSGIQKALHLKHFLPKVGCDLSCHHEFSSARLRSKAEEMALENGAEGEGCKSVG
jgi:hypothetical protein